MALRHLDGFKKYEASGNLATRLARVYTNVAGGTSIAYAAGRYGTSGGFSLNSYTAAAGFRVTPSTAGVTNFIHGFCIKKNGTGAIPLFYRTTAGATGLEFVNGAHKIHGVNKGDIGIDDGAWHHVEWIQYASGTDALYVDGILVASQTSVAFGFLEWYSNSNGDATGVNLYQISDWYVLDNTGTRNNARLGPDTRIETLVPNADDATQQWAVVGAAAAFNVLDNVPEVTGQYIASNADNQVAQVQFSNLANITDVAGVQLSVLAQNQDAGNLKDVVFVMSGTEVGTQWEPPTTIAQQVQRFDQNPIGATAWTQSSVNALVAGVKSKP